MLTGLCLGVVKLPEDIVFGRVLPALAIALPIGNLVYAWLAWQLARLALTFGEDRIRRMDLADPEAPLPERRWTWRLVDMG